MSGPLKIWYRQFARCALLFFLRSIIAPKIKVRSRAKSDWAISKSDVPSSGICRNLTTQIATPYPILKVFFGFQSSVNENSPMPNSLFMKLTAHCESLWKGSYSVSQFQSLHIYCLTVRFPEVSFWKHLVSSGNFN